MAWTFTRFSNSSQSEIDGEMTSALNKLTDLELSSSKVAVAKANGDKYDGFLYYFANATSKPKPPVGPDFSSSNWSHDSKADTEVNDFLNGTADENGVTLDASQAWYSQIASYHQKGDPAALTVFYRANKQ